MSELKTTVLIGTVISIFAVDFHDYPRKLCKTHTVGISLMDVGTGGLIFVSGLTSSAFKLQSKSVISRVINSIKVMPIIIVLASVGVLTRWLANHPEIVTEYGVHWNFFWTL